MIKSRRKKQKQNKKKTKKRHIKHKHIKHIKNIKKQKGGVTLPFTPTTNEELKNAVNEFRDKTDIANVVAKYDKMDTWNVSNITDFNDLFKNFTFDNVNDIVTNWDMRNAKSINRMFMESNFNQSLTWDLPNLQMCISAFFGCTLFNQPIQFLNMDKLSNTNEMFDSCKNFNQPLNSWNVTNVVIMENMFKGCESFNQPLDQWKLINIRNLYLMFKNCTSFNQNLNSWGIYINSTVIITGMFENCTSLIYYMQWNRNNEGKCPNCMSSNDAYEEEYKKQKDISEQIKRKKYTFKGISSRLKKGKLNAYNPITYEYMRISDWLASDTNNIIIKNNQDSFCISKLWIRSFMPMYRFIECELPDTKLQTGINKSNTNVYINLYGLGITPKCIVNHLDVYMLMTNESNDREFMLTNMGTELMVTLEGSVIHTTYKKTKFTSNIHIEPALTTIENTPLTQTIKDYTYKWDGRINKFLNSGKTPEEYVSDPVFLADYNINKYELYYNPSPTNAVNLILQKIKQFDELFMDYSHTSDEPFVVYRGLKTKLSGIRYGLNKAFVSTTNVEIITRTFMATSDDLQKGMDVDIGCCLLILTVSPGIPFLSAKKFSTFPHENEIILPRNLIYTLNRTEPNKAYIDVTMSSPDQFHQGWNCHSYPLCRLIPVMNEVMNETMDEVVESKKRPRLEAYDYDDVQWED